MIFVRVHIGDKMGLSHIKCPNCGWPLIDKALKCTVSNGAFDDFPHLFSLCKRCKHLIDIYVAEC